MIGDLCENGVFHNQARQSIFARHWGLLYCPIYIYISPAWCFSSPYEASSAHFRARSALAFLPLFSPANYSISAKSAGNQGGRGDSQLIGPSICGIILGEAWPQSGVAVLSLPEPSQTTGNLLVSGRKHQKWPNGSNNPIYWPFGMLVIGRLAHIWAGRQYIACGWHVQW